MTLGEGDMRKCINILQSTHMSIGEVSPTNVYVTTGCPMPHDIEAMLAWLLKEDFAGAFKEVWRLMSDKGLALQDVLTKVRLRRPRNPPVMEPAANQPHPPQPTRAAMGPPYARRARWPASADWPCWRACVQLVEFVALLDVKEPLAKVAAHPEPASLMHPSCIPHASRM